MPERLRCGGYPSRSPQKTRCVFGGLALPRIPLPVRWGRGFPLHRTESVSLWQRRIPEKSLSWPGPCLPCLCPARSGAPGLVLPGTLSSRSALPPPAALELLLALLEPPQVAPSLSPLPTLQPPTSRCVRTCHSRLPFLQDRLAWKRDPVPLTLGFPLTTATRRRAGSGQIIPCSVNILIWITLRHDPG